ncbi:MAG: copper-binding protein [Alphaproteobacteria bacterium]
MMLHAIGRMLLASALLTGLSVPAAAAEENFVNGEVRKVDAAAGKLTLKHEPIKNLDMDSMIMVFRVKDPSVLPNLKPGDRVRFTADRVDGAITIIKIDKVK